MRTLLIDNYDSYTYNLFQLMAETYGWAPTVLFNDDLRWRDLDLNMFDAIVISPGPGHPREHRNLGVIADLLRSTSLPVLGVCLGHQAIALMCGVPVGPAPQPRHGHLSRIRHTGQGLFSAIPQGFTAVRYHSLCVPAAELPPDLEGIAWAEDGVLMGLRHTSRPIWGVQFHPESVLTEHGAALLRNFQQLIGERRPVRSAESRSPAHPTSPSPSRSPAKDRGDDWVVLHRELDHEAEPARAFEVLFSRRRHAFWLDGSRVDPAMSRFSYMGAPLGPLGEVLSYRLGHGTKIEHIVDGRCQRVRRSIFKVLGDRLQERSMEAQQLPFDMDCGYVGFFGYELKAELGSANHHTASSPDAVWIAATRMVAIDHRDRRTYLLALARTQDAATIADALTWLDTAQDLLARGAAFDRADEPLPAGDDRAGVNPETWLRRSKEGYLADIIECQRQLRAGESYELCLTTAITLPFGGDPLTRYLQQRQLNPAPYAAFLRMADTAILCSSPERFIKVGRDRIAESKPIKGTTPRSCDPIRDAQLSEGLAIDPKNRAENLMIVDLLRNDLGKVCEVGSVNVPALMRVESYSTVHQLVSTIRGRLRDGITPVDCVRACFPGGSMTGAPKLRSIEILDRLENGPRGIYSGTLGYFALSGAADLNIVIRTAVARADRLSVGAGGAIVLDSDPMDEYEEMLLKARVPLLGLTMTPDHGPGRSRNAGGRR